VCSKVYGRILSGVAAAPPLRRRIFYWALAVGRRASRFEQEGRTSHVRAQKALADRLVFVKLRAALGGRLHFCVSGSAPLALEIAEFFHAAGILILKGTGSPRPADPVKQSPGAYKFGTVGRLPDRDPDRRGREIVARGPNIAQGYWKRRRRRRVRRRLVPHGDVGRSTATGSCASRIGRRT
jgi:long-chain acyl-CoA synthetase